MARGKFITVLCLIMAGLLCVWSQANVLAAVWDDSDPCPLDGANTDGSRADGSDGGFGADTGGPGSGGGPEQANPGWGSGDYDGDGIPNGHESAWYGIMGDQPGADWGSTHGGGYTGGSDTNPRSSNNSGWPSPGASGYSFDTPYKTSENGPWTVDGSPNTTGYSTYSGDGTSYSPFGDEYGFTF